MIDFSEEGEEKEQTGIWKEERRYQLARRAHELFHTLLGA